MNFRDIIIGILVIVVLYLFLRDITRNRKLEFIDANYGLTMTPDYIVFNKPVVFNDKV